MNPIILLVILLFIGLLIFSADVRHWISEQLQAIWALLVYYAPIVGHFLRVVMTAYSVAILIAAILIFILMALALLVGSPILTGVCTILAICLGLLVWLPAGIIARIFRLSSDVIPVSIKRLVSYTAFFSFLAFTHPEIMSLKFLLGLALVGFIAWGLRSKFDLLAKVCWPITLLIIGVIGYQYFFPENFRATTRHFGSIGTVANAWQDRRSIKNDTWAATTYGRIKDEAPVVYYAFFKADTIAGLQEAPNNQLKKGTIVKLVSRKDDVENFDGAGFIQIQLAKSNGSFVGGKKVWIEADRLDDIGTKEQVAGEDEEDSNQNNLADVQILEPGTYTYDVKAGQTIGWFAFPDCGRYNYKISSPRYDYAINFSDGTSYPGGRNTWIPEKEHPTLKIRSNSGEFITITVSKKA